jgi:hypothetical protein
MSKQTAVEWLEWQINLGLSERGLISAFKEAKQMEKEQMIEFAENYMWEHYIHKYEDRITCDQTAMEFYNETYGGAE